MGKAIFWLSGVIMLAFEVYWFAQWWGMAGVIVSFVVPPLAAVFPFIYLVKEGFSLLYFGVWAIGIAGAVYEGNREPAF